MYRRVAEQSARHSIDLSVCGELAGDPIGVAVLLGLGYRKFSVALTGLPEIREIIRHVSTKDLKRLVGQLDRAESGEDIRGPVRSYLADCGALAEQASVGLSEE